MTTTNNEVTPTMEELMAELAKAKAENELLKANAIATPSTLSFKVSEKGAVSVYGIQTRFPVSLYPSQWEKLIENLPKLQQFMALNKTVLDKYAEEFKNRREAERRADEALAAKAKAEKLAGYEIVVGPDGKPTLAKK